MRLDQKWLHQNFDDFEEAPQSAHSGYSDDGGASAGGQQRLVAGIVRRAESARCVVLRPGVPADRVNLLPP